MPELNPLRLGGSRGALHCNGWDGTNHGFMTFIVKKYEKILRLVSWLFSMYIKI